MYGAFLGDIIGSYYKLNNVKTTDFELFHEGCCPTDDSILVTGVARAIIESYQACCERPVQPFEELLAVSLKQFCRKNPRPPYGGYGLVFSWWLHRKHDYKPKSYRSSCNGAAVRAVPCGLAAVTLGEAKRLGRASAVITHDHPEGIKGAETVAAGVFMAKTGYTKAEIKEHIQKHYYSFDFTIASIRKGYEYSIYARDTVPQAFEAFFESSCFEDAVRRIVSIGGNSDTMAAITGALAYAYYTAQHGGSPGWITEMLPSELIQLRDIADEYLPDQFKETAVLFHELCCERANEYKETGSCRPIMPRLYTKENYPASLRCRYEIGFVKSVLGQEMYGMPGDCQSSYDHLSRRWRLRIQIDDQKKMIFSVFLSDKGEFIKYSLDIEREYYTDHYTYTDELGIREAIYSFGDENKYLDEILTDYYFTHGSAGLIQKLEPFVVSEFRY